ncbi:MAG: class I SAM-dependent methyltransferase [Nanoarchaeota archaeon]
MDRIQTHFSKTVKDYDTIAEKVVFKNDELHNELVNAICLDKNKRLKVLDLGCGTGHGMSLMAQKFPNSRITGIDFSPKMIEKSKINLAKYSDRIELIEMDFRNYHFNQKFDAVVSAIAIHNIQDEEKSELFERIYDSLDIGGQLINADFYKHEFYSIDDQLRMIYKNFLEKNLEGEELNTWLMHAFEEDMPMTLASQSNLLANIGFSNFKLLWMFNNEAIYSAMKS